MVNEEYRVDGKVAIVTGAGRGIGKAIALTLAEAGADITVVARTKEQIEQTAEDIRKLGRKALAIPADVSQEDQVKKVVEQTVSRYGKIDILVNNAGIAVSKPVVLIPGAEFAGFTGKVSEQDEQTTLQEWRQVIDTNLTGAFIFAQAVGPYMMKQKKGKVVITSSTSADEGTPLVSAYCVSKAGLSSFTRCLASEWAPFNICVNAIAPGWTNTEPVAYFMRNTEMKESVLKTIPSGRLAEPREVALLALFLASEASNHLTGQIITLDGGTMGRGPDVY